VQGSFLQPVTQCYYYQLKRADEWQLQSKIGNHKPSLVSRKERKERSKKVDDVAGQDVATASLACRWTKATT
jgi:hypothetical protein